MGLVGYVLYRSVQALGLNGIVVLGGGRLRDALEVAKMLRSASFLEGLAFTVSARTASASELLVEELRSEARHGSAWR
eukprot:Skav205591  [mRNA]  locus=scaffold460:116742:118761:+ [translate_table: standard]